LLGREIQTAYGKPNPQMVMLLPLIEGTDGLVKMSKSYPEHCISLTDSAKDMYGKLMSIPDTLIIKYYSLLTDISDSDLKIIEERLKSENPRDIKMELAYTITNEYHNDADTKKAQDEFVNVVQNKGIPEDIESYVVANDTNILELLVSLNFVASKGEAKRLIAQGGLKINNEKISDTNYIVSVPAEPVVMQAGKRKFIKLVK
jgi:tyrosyl-tRNA synthetase